MSRIDLLAGGGDLFDSDTRRLRMVQAYYDAWLEDGRLRDALAAIIADLQPHVAERLTRSARTLEEEAVIYGPDRDAALLARHTSDLSPSGQALIAAFVRSSHLPHPDGAIDLWDAARWRWPDDPLTLHAGFRARMREIPVGRIIPKQPDSFVYDPRKHSRNWVEAQIARVTAEVRSDILAQFTMLREHAKANGWMQLSTRHRREEDMLRLARRVRRRAVEGLPWDEIAEAEYKEGHERPDTSAVITTVTSWANALKIDLPKRPVGRPRKTN